LVTIGYTAMLIGAIDPMEGAFIILPGSGLVLLGTYLSRSERWLVLYRFWIFLMITIGVAAMLGFTILGGIGGTTDYSLWWGLLFLPYPIAWSVGIWGPDSPRWVLWLGIGAGVWYLAILVMTQYFTFAAEADVGTIVGILIGIIGALTISGCIYRLRNRNA
jgi:hypothetical protein